MSFTTLVAFNSRYYRRHLMLSLLCMLGISLGVGIVIAVELINRSALESFSSSVDFLSGRTTHAVVSRYGWIDEKLFKQIWTDPDVRAASPVVEVMASTLESRGEVIRFVGIDPFLDAPFRDFVPRGGDEPSFVKFLVSDPPSVFLSGDLMDRYGLETGHTLTVLSAGVEKKLAILGKMPASSAPVGGEDLAVMDISAAQHVFGRTGELGRIDLIVHGDPSSLKNRLPDSLRLTDANERKTTLRSMLYSFQLNLAAMSMLGIFVGTFLIYNFAMFSVLSRREDMSLLLTLGSDRSSMVCAFVAESLMLGALGSLAGLGFGVLVAWFSIEKVSGTISDLYFHVSVQSAPLTLPVALSGLAVGFLATLVGTALPALEVAVTPPVLGMKRRSIEDRTHSLKRYLFVASIICAALSLVTAWASRFSIFWGFFSAFAMTLAFALLTPGFLSPFTHWLGITLKRVCGSVEAFLAARTVRASLSRTSIAVAALTVALSMTIGVDTMIHSFRESVAHWLDGSLQGDLYISPGTTRWGHPLPDSLVDSLQQDPRVQAMERYSTYEITLNGRPARLRVLDGSVLERRTAYHFLQGAPGAWQALRDGKVFISESLAFRSGLKVRDNVVLATPEGDRPFPIAAVVRDYSSDQGTIQMDRQVYERIWEDRRIQSIALFLSPGVSAEVVRKELSSRYQGMERTIVSNVRMREDILKIFDKTFAPTATLKGVSLLVALLGIATALTAILMERSRDMKVMEYLGLTPGELGRMNIYEALIMGLAACLLSAACGLILSLIIIYAINYRSFGWSVDVHVNAWVFLKTFALTGLACFAASLYPTYRLTRAAAARALDED
jgi:putative ABC transport system permease protein